MQKKGLTLLEILVAMMILALTVAGSASLFVAAKRHIMHSRGRVTAAETAKYYLEALQSEVRQDKWGANTHCLSGDGSTGCEAPDSWLDASLTAYKPEWKVSSVAGSSVRKVKLKLTWEEKIE